MSRGMFSARLHHVGVIVPGHDQVRMLLDLLGLRAGRTQYVAEYAADCVFTDGPGAGIELIVPREGKLARFNKGAGGLHHIALEVDDLHLVRDALREKDIHLLEQEPVEAGELRINFLPPAYTRGLIVEFVQQGRASADA